MNIDKGAAWIVFYYGTVPPAGCYGRDGAYVDGARGATTAAAYAGCRDLGQ